MRIGQGKPPWSTGDTIVSGQRGKDALPGRELRVMLWLKFLDTVSQLRPRHLATFWWLWWRPDVSATYWNFATWQTAGCCRANQGHLSALPVGLPQDSKGRNEHRRKSHYVSSLANWPLAGAAWSTFNLILECRAHFIFTSSYCHAASQLKPEASLRIQAVTLLRAPLYQPNPPILIV